MTYFVYILYSKKLAKFYVGLTNDLSRRLKQHNNGESNYTSTGIPWMLIWSTTKPTLRAAEILEQKLKNLSRDRKIKFIHKYADGIHNPDLLNSLEFVDRY